MDTLDAPDTPPAPPPEGGSGGIDPNDPRPNWARPTHRHAVAPITHRHHRHIPGRPTENAPVNPYRPQPGESITAWLNRSRGLASVLPADPAPPAVKQEPPIVVTANDPNTIVAEGDGAARVELPQHEDLKKQFGIFNPLLKGEFEHTDPNDPYFSAEVMSKRGPERHPPGFNFLGPGTEFEARMIGENGDFYKFAMERAGRKPRGTYPYNKPYNDVDACAMDHDRVFTKKGTTKEEAENADRIFEECLYSKPRTQSVYTEAIRDMAAMAMKIKGYVLTVSGTDDPFFKQKLSVVNATINTLNTTAVENATGNPDKAEANWWAWTMNLFWRLGLNAVGSTITVSTTMALQKARNTDVNELTAGIQNRRTRVIVKTIVEMLAKQMPVASIMSFLTGIAEEATSNGLAGLFQASALFQQATVNNAFRYQVNQFILRKFEDYFDWIDASYKSDKWRAEKAATPDDIRRIMNEAAPQDVQPASNIHGTLPDWRAAYGISRKNASVRRMIDLTVRHITRKENKVQNLIEFFGIMNQLRVRRNTVFYVLQQIYANTLENQLIGKGTLTQKEIKKIFNKILSPSDVDLIMGTQAQYELAGESSTAYASPGNTGSQVTQRLIEGLTYTQLFSSLDGFEDFSNLIN